MAHSITFSMFSYIAPISLFIYLFYFLFFHCCHALGRHKWKPVQLYPWRAVSELKSIMTMVLIVLIAINFMSFAELIVYTASPCS